MKSARIIYLEKILRFMAKTVLWKYKPMIVGITGSVGKTSAKEAVFLALSFKFNVRKNEKNYNNEIGIPLTIIGAQSGNRSIAGWIRVFFKWLAAVIFPIEYPKILILEMGADRPGDIEYLLSFIKPSVGIITAISESHLEFFKSIVRIAKEKRKLIKELPLDGIAVLNGDDEKVSTLKSATSAPAVFFGSGENCQFKFSDISFNYNNFEPQGISFKLNYDGKVVPIRLPNVLAPHLIYAALAAIATGIFFKINLIEVAKALEGFIPPRGRMSLIAGKNESFIIDDTYNASPVSASAALGVLKECVAIRKIVALGDMLELGEVSDSGHKKIARSAFENGTNLFFAVGDRMKKAFRELESEEKLFGRIFYFDDSDSAGNELGKILKKGDLVLVKGSQGMRMEKTVEKLLVNSSEAEKLLCRQDSEWLKKPFVKP